MDERGTLRSDLSISIEQSRKQRDNNALWLNSTSTATGTRHIETDYPYSSYGFEDIKVWIPKYQKWFSCGNKVVTIEGPMNVAIREFYDRWRIYTNRRFNLSNIQITQP